MSSSISNRAIMMSHFFHGRGSEIQQSPLGLFRALAYQLLKSAPTRLTQAIGKLREMGGQPTWQMEWLRSFLEKHICQACTTQPIVIFIDALDECVIEARDYVANFLTDIIRGSTGACLKIFVSCRHYPNLFTEGSRMEMDNNSKEDLTIFVKSRLQTLSDWKRPIASQIIENARGSFQWAGIVTNKAIILHREGRTVDQIREEIKTIPKDIFELYDSLLWDLNNDDKQLAYRLFLWVCFARQPLTIRELQYALMLSPNMKEKRLKDIFQRADFRTELPDMVNMIVYLSRGLIEIIPKREWDFGIFFHSDSNAPLQHTWNSDVQVIHQTVVDYLLQTGLPRLEQSQQIRAEASGGHYHHFIAESCLRLVEMDDYTTPTGLLKTIDFMLSDAGCLSEYVASHFRTHLFELEDEGVDMVDLLRLLGWPHNKSRLAHISMLYEGGLKDVPDSIFLEVYLDSSMKCQRNPLVRGDVSRSKHLSLLHFLSGMGFAKTVKWMVENKLSGLNDDFLLDGSLDATLPHPDGNNKRQSLVVDGYYNPNLLAIPTAETALHLAVVKSRTSVFLELLKSPLIDPNIQDRAGRTPLHVTQIIFLNQNERRRMVERLLQSPGIKVDLQDIHGRTPFFYAAECGHVEDFQMLLDAAGDNLDIRDEQGFTALAAAAGMGNVAAVEVIINSGKCSREGLQLAYDTSARWQKKPSKSGYYTESERRRAPLPLILEFPEEIRRETVRVPEMQKCRRLLFEAHPSLQADASLDEEQGDTLSKWSD